MDQFVRGLTAVCVSLARQIVADGEGASKWVVVRVHGAADERSARTVAKAIGNSLLVKTAIAGADANWGRILAAAGASGERVPLEKLVLKLDGVTVFRDGVPIRLTDEEERRIFRGPQVEIDLDLGLGRAAWTVYTCDLTEEYVRINAEYRT